MLRCPARSENLVSLEDGSESDRKRATFGLRSLHSEQSLSKSLQVGQVSLIGGRSGGLKCAEFVVHEFGASEKILEDIDLKAAPSSNGRFSKIDMTAENATLPNETPVLRASL